MLKRLLLPAIALAMCCTSFGVAQTKTIAQTAIDAGNFNTLVAAAKAAGLVDTLNGHQQLTVFAPTDEAFAKLNPATIQSLLQPENKGQLTSILTYHLVPGRVNASAAYDLRSATTVNGQRLPLDFQGDFLKVGDSIVTVTDIPCSNGIIHVIDTVLLPANQTIPEIASGAGQFNTLLAAAQAAGLADVLGTEGPFTVLAPTDDAFAALPAGTVDTLLQPENKSKLAEILKYHVISGRVYDTDAVQAGRAKTLAGRNINVNFGANGLKINEAYVVSKNIDASNGVIHIIDQVLIPQAMSRQSSMDLLQDAVTRGAPVFNSGDHGQCCKIYMETMETLMSAGIENADDHTMRMIENTLTNARNHSNMSNRAWALRGGIDSLYTRLSQMKETMPTQMRVNR